MYSISTCKETHKEAQLPFLKGTIGTLYYLFVSILDCLWESRPALDINSALIPPNPQVQFIKVFYSSTKAYTRIYTQQKLPSILAYTLYYFTMSNQSGNRSGYSGDSSQATNKTAQRSSIDSTNTDSIRRSIYSSLYDGVEDMALAIPTSQLPGRMQSAHAVNTKRGESNSSPAKRARNAQEVRMTKGKTKIVDVPKKKNGDEAADKNDADSAAN